MERYEELDSIRGLAALTVVFSHFMISFDFNGWNTYNQEFSGNWYKYSPLHIFWAGHEAVILFFILSGFVLTLPFLNNKPFNYGGYVVKRVFRILPASMISILTAFVLILIMDVHTRPINSEWISSYWVNKISLKEFLSELFLIGNVEVSINPVLWSLIHEMRLSIVFPIIAFLVIKYDWKKTIALALVLSVVGFGMTLLLEAPRLNVWETVRYSSVFMVGSLLAKYRNLIIQRVMNLNRVYKLLFLLTAVVFYTFEWVFYGMDLIHIPFLRDWLITIGGSLFIILGLSSLKISKLLKAKLPSFFGRISYSLYLYHLIILIFFMQFDTGLSVSNTLILTFLASVFISFVSYEYIEKPFIKIGRSIEKKVRNEESKEEYLKSS